MAISKKISETPAIILVGIILLSIFLIYKLVIFLSKVFVYLGFNLFLFTDNLLKFETISPIVLWGILGLVIGSIFGVIIAIKKFKLSKTLVLFPIAFMVIFITILAFVNKPKDAASGTFIPSQNEGEQTTTVPTATPLYYSITQTVNVRLLPSAKSAKLFTLQQGTEVEFIENVRDARNKLWTKIGFTNPQTGYKQIGYVNANYVRYSN